MPFSSAAVRFTGAAGLVAVAGICLVYGGSIHSGLYYDDYHFVRPWSAIELRRVWFGSWDPTGIESVFYRPLTAWGFAARFWLFGVNATALHIVSLAGHVACATLVGWFVRREGARSEAALIGTWLYAVHPAFAYAQVSWLTNQMHLAQSLLVLLALLYWQKVRERPLIFWLPLVAIAIVLFLVKEDGVMLLPALLLTSVVRYGWNYTWLRRTFLALAASVLVIVVGLISFRYHRLRQLGGYGIPTVEGSLANLWKGLNRTLFIWPTRRPWQALSSLTAIVGIIAAVTVGAWKRRRPFLIGIGLALAAGLFLNVPSILLNRTYPLWTSQALASGVAVTILAVGSGVALWHTDRKALLLVGTGLAVSLSFDLPFAFVSGRERYHLVTLGAVLVSAAAAEALINAVGIHAKWAVCSLIVCSAPLVMLARSQVADFRPCTPYVLEMDRDVHGWWIVPEEIKSWFETKATACTLRTAVPQLPDLPFVVWNLYEEQRPTSGEPFRWTSEHAVFLVNRRATSITFAVRRSDATASQPVHVRVTGDVRPTMLVLGSPEWKYATVNFRSSLLQWLRAGHRFDLTVDRWFVPALVVPQSDDLRRMGVELKVMGIQPQLVETRR